MLVSTVIAAFNAQHTLGQAIDSALNQHYSSHEIIVADDGSTDKTAAILRGYGGQIRIISQSNQGAAAARNAGVRHARGRYVAFLDSDDLWMNGKLETMLPALERNPKASLAFSNYLTFSQTGIEAESSSLGFAPSLKQLKEESLPPILTSTWIVRRSAFEQSGGFSKAFIGGQGFEDSWMLLRLRELGEFIYIPQVLSRYRIDINRENADRYGRSLKTFVRLARERYGRHAEALVRNAKNLQCRFLMSKLAHQLDRGERGKALLTLGRIAHVRPAFFFTSEFTGRLILPQNAARLAHLITLSKFRKDCV